MCKAIQILDELFSANLKKSGTGLLNAVFADRVPSFDGQHNLHFDLSDLINLLLNQDPHARCALAGDLSLSPSVLAMLTDDENPLIRQKAEATLQKQTSFRSNLKTPVAA